MTVSGGSCSSGEITPPALDDLALDVDASVGPSVFSVECWVPVEPGRREVTTYLAYDPEVDVSIASGTIVVGLR